METPIRFEREMAEAIAQINTLRERLFRRDLKPVEKHDLEQKVDAWRVRLAEILSGRTGS